MPFRMETDGWDFSYLVEVPFFSSISCKTNLPRSHFVEVPHIQQLSTWDCGLACVLMVLKTLGIDCGDIPCLEKLCCTTSVWTVDLAHLLHKFSVKFFFLTVTLGANPNYAVESFYQDNLPDDIRRVNGQFQVALENGINIQCRSIGGEEISVLILSGKFVAVALVDKHKLSCRPWLEEICLPEIYGGTSGYTGHFVVICGYDADTNEFEIRDPASSRKYERVSLECLEEARKSFGTDEDILLILLDKEEGGEEASIICPSG
ncbi:protein GUCD1 isoform X1 [Amborella trichopoda]|uniref:protein GUCD1 isoform X1 n=1 Tax=Amborella trichopoda TaxID=13333 RepID=UPI0005D3DE90|nr:protein GUCD1 isoform X1 [Amborella trichopoda]XP_020526593.1 protein GUCD1 isoform X1 [Amborella trichopoda]|eukprot:XP_011625587.1 protein GUCD1 isoform X1 [Amborella trichopoda]